MSRVERDGYLGFNGVECSEPWFELTEMGERWIESGLDYDSGVDVLWAETFVGGQGSTLLLSLSAGRCFPGLPS